MSKTCDMHINWINILYITKYIVGLKIVHFCYIRGYTDISINWTDFWVFSGDSSGYSLIILLLSLGNVYMDIFSQGLLVYYIIKINLLICK